MDDAVAECGPEFYRLACAPRREETLLAPELAPDRGERIGEGGPPLAVPGRGRDLEPGVAAEAGGEQGHDGEQAEQARRGAGDGLVRPLLYRAVRIQATGAEEMPATAAVAGRRSFPVKSQIVQALTVCRALSS